MSSDMFKKMKDRITDEVSSATYKLQNQLASSIGQQIRNDMEPNQLVPEPHGSINNFPINSQFSLIDDAPVGGYNEEEELNSELSPQHQLFNEYSIKRLNQSTSINNGKSLDNHNETAIKLHYADNSNTVINIYELSSDIEDGLDETSKEDVEIDLLSDKLVNNHEDMKVSNNNFPLYKTKYRDIVHDLRKIHQELQTERGKSQVQRQEFSKQLQALKMELELTKQQHESLISNSTTASENEKINVGSPQPVTKSSTKLKDLEKLLAKCKESLKLKNSQIKTLKESLSEVEKFKDYNQELKRELAELREAHEFWTVSIAENKRIMHQEIEDKNGEMERLRSEINDLQSRLSDGNNTVRQLKQTIQDLESRLVRTSAAHQKERESLTKELNSAKNSAIRQVQKESERNIERIKLDLEKSIEGLKLELLNKDEQIIKSAERQQQLHEQNHDLVLKLEDANKQLQEQLRLTEEALNKHKLEVAKCSDLNLELENIKSLGDEQKNLVSENKELSNQVKNLETKLKSAEAVKCELDNRLNELDKITRDCESCECLNERIKKETERFQQELHELTTRLDLMTSANDDQEKEIKSLTVNRNNLNSSYKFLKADFEELHKKNESLARVIQENETDMQNQQEQLDRLMALNQELDNRWIKENTLLLSQLSQYKSELDERTAELTSSKNQIEELVNDLTKLKIDSENTQTIIAELRKDKNSLTSQIENFIKQRRELDEQLVVRILSALKNLETPNTSPGSDKSYGSKHADGGDEEERKLPNPITLIEELSSMALDRSTAYLTTSQRLQAVLLENTMMCEELRRLKDELNNLNRESNLATQCSLEESERLRTENQALIHDQQAYDERITSLEGEIEKLNKRLATRDDCDVIPDSTQFEYLKNIVYQFMLGKEPLVLARVISAVFKFEKGQIEQICRIQEAIHSTSRQNS